MTSRIRYVLTDPTATVHEGKRAKRVQELRSLGFLRYEAREFAKVSPDDPAVQRIINSRRRLVGKLARQARELDWSPEQRRRELAAAVRKVYKDRRALVKDGAHKGKPSPWELRRKMAPVSLNPKDFEQLKGYPYRKKKGKVANQRFRRREARRTAGQLALTETGAVDNGTILQWLASKARALGMATTKERRSELEEGIRRLQGVLRRQGG